MTDTLIPTIIEKVAEAEGVSPDELKYSLHEYIEPDAIAMLGRHSRGSWTLSFDLPTGRVRVSRDGTVVVDPEQRQQFPDTG